MSSSSDDSSEVESWVEWFLLQDGNEFFCEIDRSYIGASCSIQVRGLPLARGRGWRHHAFLFCSYPRRRRYCTGLWSVTLRRIRSSAASNLVSQAGVGPHIQQTHGSNPALSLPPSLSLLPLFYFCRHLILACRRGQLQSLRLAVDHSQFSGLPQRDFRCV